MGKVRRRSPSRSVRLRSTREEGATVRIPVGPDVARIAFRRKVSLHRFSVAVREVKALGASSFQTPEQAGKSQRGQTARMPDGERGAAVFAQEQPT